MALNFNSIPLTNSTQCALNFVGCGATLDPGDAQVLTCSCSTIVDLDFPFSVYETVEDRTFSPPTFGAVTVCNPDVVVITFWNPADGSSDEVQVAFSGRLELVRRGTSSS